jgi:hypothetical protein
MRALVRTAHGVYAVDLEDEEVLGLVDDTGFAERIAVRDGETMVVATEDGHPPLRISVDGGASWSDAGAGLPPVRALAIAGDVVLYAARNRLFVSEDAGRFWRALTVELPEIEAVALEP